MAWASPVPVVTVLWCLNSVCPNIQVKKAYAHPHRALPPRLPQESLQLFPDPHHLNYRSSGSRLPLFSPLLLSPSALPPLDVREPWAGQTYLHA